MPSFQICKLFGIDIKIQRNLLAVYAFIMLYNHDNIDYGLGFVMVYSIVLLLVLLHELGHALTAKYFNHNCELISIGFLGGIASINTEDVKNYEEFVIIIAGPLVNLYLYFIFLPWSDHKFFELLANINLVLFTFNMVVCIWPMDGGRIVKCILRFLYTDKLKIENLSFSISLFAAFVALLYFYHYSIYNGIAISLFMTHMAYSEKCRNVETIMKSQEISPMESVNS